MRKWDKEYEWAKNKYDRFDFKIDKQLGTELREKLEKENISITEWFINNVKKYLQK